jgi:cell division protein FtsA
LAEIVKYPQHLVFGLDIGTRSIVGTVGYKERDTFNVVAQYVKEHDTRAMMDGQIHDINKVGETIGLVKDKLEEQIGRKLTEVCIAAAGRVLRTVTVQVEYEFPDETVVNSEHIYSLDLLGVEKAHDEINSNNETDIKFYCVGYTVVKYYLNNYIMGNLENHRANKISAELIATFLPEEVVTGLNSAVGMADLEVANLTLEPIAAINVAIPEMYRMLNIALVDVGAGTSDISITKDGSIIAYGMIPHAGDELTEIIAKHCLVDFASAEGIKFELGLKKKSITYKDII